ncbi:MULTISPECIES: poly-gamma-glutamate synthase PgsB [unclassified Corynebacterium]|uniref:poly-gamma-glutamate synthase PgsB n=1 Tax=unclassified Corynebacterium TaxID=2624378 RepID=UPI0029C9C944|nr:MULTISPECIES: poly-gamma-glutamate synthase PgsB [unclassified Corynebacterium]WPF65315.1 poly-gamma-glutamate synthase PgsB [Corynebacterium sp. 22KM0430]WPF67810.1 poly-gamma-glutamate synthase PgsB [Corynebacterium sp. 21KM1197]
MLAFLAMSGALAGASMTYFHRHEREHRARLDGLRYHVHVNGIRGKSTLTRMIGGVLREAGHNTISKTTGTYACVIDGQAEEHPIRRTGPANINEQYRFVKEWITPEIDALVVECMAVKPKYQRICQDTILRSPITVITNVRLDHQEDMGDTLEEIAASLCNTVPENGVVITGERSPKLVEIIRRHAEERGSRLIVAEETELSHSLVPRFSYQQFEENIAVALAVAEELGIDTQTAVRGMIKAAPDPGTTSVTEIHQGEDSMFWVPMFAVNDWESTVRVFDSVSETFLPDSCRRVVALNNRSDRTDRAAMFIDLVSTDLRAEIDRVVLYGDLQEVVRQRLIDQGFPEAGIITTADCEVEDETEDGKELVARARRGFEGHDVAIFGMVNIHTDHVTAMRRYISDVVEHEPALSSASTSSSTTEAESEAAAQ